MKGSTVNWIVIALNIFLIAAFVNKKQHALEKNDQKTIEQIHFSEPLAKPITNISVSVPPYLDYPDIVKQVQKWEEEAPGLVETGFYGQSRKGIKIAYIRLTNKLIKKDKPVVLLTASIHGNEPWSTSCMMAYTGRLLSEYSKNTLVSELLDSRDIFIVPVVSPDSYPNSRDVDKVDPNRDFPGINNPDHISSPSVVAIQDFFLKIRPKAVISGHTYGRKFLTPYGDIKKTCPNESDYQEIVGQMSKMCNYKLDRTCNNYGKPISGTEVDWYYRNGSFSVIMEIGTHQNKPTEKQIKEEYGRTWESILYFLQYAPLIEIKAGEDFDFSGNTGISGRFLPLLKDDYVQLGP